VLTSENDILSLFKNLKASSVRLGRTGLRYIVRILKAFNAVEAIKAASI